MATIIPFVFTILLYKAQADCNCGYPNLLTGPLQQIISGPINPSTGACGPNIVTGPPQITTTPPQIFTVNTAQNTPCGPNIIQTQLPPQIFSTPMENSVSTSNIIQGPMLPPITTSINPFSTQISPLISTLNPATVTSVVPTTNSPPVVISTTVIDNSLSNSLANALQLLIVSDLIDSTINPSPILANVAPLVDVSPAPIYSPQFDVIGPVVDVVPNFTPELIQPCDYNQQIDVSPNFIFPNFLKSPSMLNGVTEVVSPVSFNNGADRFAPFSLPPVTAEVLFPSAIPAQLTCNFGFVPTTMPCVSVNVETLPMGPEPCGCANSKMFY